MTYATNVFWGYALAAVATASYVAWVIRRGHVIGRDIGIGADSESGQAADEASRD